MDQTSSMDGISKRKQNIEELLLQEEKKLLQLSETLEKADDLTNNMVSILTNFDERLLKLEETILPVHRKTKDLQRLQDNIEKTITALDHVISYHHVARDVESILERGPSRQVDAYIKCMDRLDKSVQFFTENNPDSPELNTVKQLFDKGKDGLEREFKQQLFRQSKPVLVRHLIDMEFDFDGDVLTEACVIDANAALSENTINDLSKVAKWLSGPGASVGFTDNYATIRSDNILKTLSMLKDHVKKLSLNSGNRKVSAIKDTPKKTGSRRARNFDWRKEGSNRNSSFSTITEEDVVDIDVEPFIQVMSCAVKLFQIEHCLMNKVIPENVQKRGIFDLVIREGLELINQDGMKFVHYLRQCTLRHDHASIVNVFPVMKHLKLKQPLYHETLQDTMESSRMKVPQLIGQMDSTGAKVLDDFTDSVKSDPEKESNMPKDGTVHELTSNVMLFMQQLASNMSMAGGMLAAQQHHETVPPKGRNKECLAQYLSHVLGALKLNLENKSHVYLDESLAAVFLLNNYDFILTALNRSGILELVKTYIADIEKIYKEVIQDQRNKYIRCWLKFSQYLSMENKQGIVLNIQPGMKLKDKEKAIVKDKFKSFNADIHDLVKLHRGWAMPSEDIKFGIRSSLEAQIVPAYTAFVDKFKLVQFTKNIEKFIKYSSEDVSKMIGCIFDQSALL